MGEFQLTSRHQTDYARGIMRTTLTLDDDIGIEIARLRDTQKLGLKEIVNRAMRLGLQRMTAVRPAKRKKFQTPVLKAKSTILQGVVKTHDMLVLGEGENYR